VGITLEFKSGFIEQIFPDEAGLVIDKDGPPPG